ncbi:MAG TPA: YfhO family protein, partial [Thermomicrobiales bacterium]|nr:YfhO family protein [Thermomicrobiales bacterium]
AMNGGTQDYHWLDPFPHVLAKSTLLDMLNVRYIIIARSVPLDRPDFQAIAAGRQVAYEDPEVVIYENAQAYDRAWIVHDVRAERGNEGILQLANGSVDGRHVAFVDGAIPAATPPEPALASRESVTITDYRDDELSASVTAASPGLVVFSEAHADGWRAYVDGEEVDILRTNGALRGVPVPAGEHTIEMRYDPVELRIGLWTTGITGMALLALAAWNGRSLLRGVSRAPDASAPLAVPAVGVAPVSEAGPQSTPARKRMRLRRKGRRSGRR